MKKLDKLSNGLKWWEKLAIIINFLLNTVGSLIVISTTFDNQNKELWQCITIFIIFTGNIIGYFYIMQEVLKKY